MGSNIEETNIAISILGQATTFPIPKLEIDNYMQGSNKEKTNYCYRNIGKILDALIIISPTICTNKSIITNILIIIFNICFNFAVLFNICLIWQKLTYLNLILTQLFYNSETVKSYLN